jgi:D-inositol-3-phosphate glycosyltransferase
MAKTQRTTLKLPHLALITLHADPATPPGASEGGGTHSYIRELMIGLTRHEWGLTVLTRWADSNLPQSETISSRLRIVRLRIGEIGPLDKRVLDDLHPISLSAARSALQEVPNLSLIHSVYWNSGRVGMELAASRGIPFVHTVISNGWRRQHHGLCDQPANRVATEAKVFEAAFAIFCVSGQERSDLVEHYGVDPFKMVVVGRPVASVFQHPCHDELGSPASLRWPEKP